MNYPFIQEGEILTLCFTGELDGDHLIAKLIGHEWIDWD